MKKFALTALAATFATSLSAFGQGRHEAGTLSFSISIRPYAEFRVGSGDPSTASTSTTVSMDLASDPNGNFISNTPFTECVVVKSNAGMSLILPASGEFSVSNASFAAPCQCTWTGTVASETNIQHFTATGATGQNFTLHVDVLPNTTYAGPDGGGTYTGALTITLCGA